MMLYHATHTLPWAAPLAVLAMLIGCAPSAQPQGTGRAPSITDTYVYRCEGDYRFSVRVGLDTARVRLDGGEVALPHVVSASGARYAARGLTYWSKGREAILETSGASYRHCVGQPVGTVREESRLLAGEGPTGIPLVGTDWRLMSVGGVPALSTPDRALPYLHFTAEKRRIAGSTGCNRLTGGYAVQGDRLRFLQSLATTRMACLASHLAEQERSLLDALQRVDGFHVWGDVLTLLDGVEVVARFTL